MCTVGAQHTQIIGHRGAMGHAPENTVLSIQKALELGVDSIEIDVFRCQSGEIVVFHDKKLNKLTNGKGKIQQKTWSQLQELQVMGSESIPVLEEIIQLINGRVRLNIELKGKGTAIPTIEILKKYFNKDLLKQKNILVSSFDWDELLALRSKSQKIPIGVLIDGNPLLALKFAKEVDALSINSDYKFLNKNNVDLINSKGYKLYPYTVNDGDEMKKLVSIGVDGIITDYPDKLKKILNYF